MHKLVSQYFFDPISLNRCHDGYIRFTDFAKTLVVIRNRMNMFSFLSATGKLQKGPIFLSIILRPFDHFPSLFTKPVREGWLSKTLPLIMDDAERDVVVDFVSMAADT